jgi:hypothetical protein
MIPDHQIKVSKTATQHIFAEGNHSLCQFTIRPHEALPLSEAETRLRVLSPRSCAIRAVEKRGENRPTHESPNMLVPNKLITRQVSAQQAALLCYTYYTFDA